MFRHAASSFFILTSQGGLPSLKDFAAPTPARRPSMSRQDSPGMTAVFSTLCPVTAWFSPRWCAILSSCRAAGSRAGSSRTCCTIAHQNNQSVKPSPVELRPDRCLGTCFYTYTAASPSDAIARVDPEATPKTPARFNFIGGAAVEPRNYPMRNRGSSNAPHVPYIITGGRRNSPWPYWRRIRPVQQYRDGRKRRFLVDPFLERCGGVPYSGV